MINLHVVTTFSDFYRPNGSSILRKSKIAVPGPTIWGRNLVRTLGKHFGESAAYPGDAGERLCSVLVLKFGGIRSYPKQLKQQQLLVSIHYYCYYMWNVL